MVRHYSKPMQLLSQKKLSVPTIWDTIQPGLDFIKVVQEAVGACDGFLAVFGREWLQASDATGGPLLDDPEDLARLEIATALERYIRVIPLLVQGAQPPRSVDLPYGLKELASRNALG